MLFFIRSDRIIFLFPWFRPQIFLWFQTSMVPALVLSMVQDINGSGHSSFYGPGHRWFRPQFFLWSRTSMVPALVLSMVPDIDGSAHSSFYGPGHQWFRPQFFLWFKTLMVPAKHNIEISKQRNIYFLFRLKAIYLCEK